MRIGLFRIGEISKLFGLSVKTLRFYDEISLFKAHYIDNKTGYRYYSTDQFEKLRLIIYLKNMGMPLDDIGNELRQQSYTHYLSTLKGHLNMVEDRIRKDLAVKKHLEQRIIEINRAENSPRNIVFFEEYPEQNVLLFRRNINGKADMLQATLEFQRMYDFSSGIGRFGQLFTLNYGVNSICQCVGLFLPDYTSQHNHNVYQFPRGLYAVLYYSQITDKSDPFWVTLLNEINCNEYEIAGDAIRTVVLEKGLGIGREEYLAQIRVPVRKTS